MKHDSASTQPRHRRGRGLWWKAPIALLVLLVVFIALLPTFVSWGLGHGVIRGAIQDRVNGDVALGAINASWFGEQKVQQFVVTAPDGTKAVDLTATLHASLFDLLTGGPDTFEVDLAGAIDTVVRDDGSLGIQNLIKRDPNAPPSPPTPPSSRSNIPAAIVNINTLQVALRGATPDDTLELKDITGTVTLKPGEIVQADLEGASIARGERGTFKLTASAKNAIDRTGAFTPSGAAAAATVAITNVPVPQASAPTLVRDLTLDVQSDDLAKRVAVSIVGEAQVEGEAPSAIDGEVEIASPFSADGQPTISLAAITGSITGTRVPTALLQPFIAAGSPVRLERDVGPVVDVSATFAEGEEKRIEFTLSAAALQAQVAGMVNTADRSFVGNRVLLAARVDPELAQGLAKIGIDQPGRVRAELARVSIPTGEAGAFDLGKIAIAGTVAIENALAVTLPGEDARALQVRGATVNIESDAIGSLVRAHGNAAVDEMTVEFDESITDLVGPDGEIAFDSLVPEGTVKVAGISENAVQAFLPGIADLVTANKVLPAAATVRTTPSEGGWNAELAITGNKLEALTTAQRDGDVVTAQVDRVDMRVSPQLVAQLQQGSESPIALVGPAQLHMTSEPVELDARQLAETDFASIPLRLQGDFAEATLSNVPGIEGNVLVRGFDALITVRRKPERWYGADGSATLALASDGSPVALARFDVSLGEVNGAMQPTGMIALDDINVATLEHALGREAGSLAVLFGDGGDVQLTLDRQDDTFTSNVDAALENLSGSFAATLSPELFTLSAKTSKLVLAQDALNRFLARSKAAPGKNDATQAATLTALSDVPLNAEVRSFRVPVAALKGEPIDSKMVDIDIALSGGPASFSDPTLGTLVSESIAASISSHDLAQGISFQADIKAVAEGESAQPDAGAKPTQLKIAGTLTNLLGDDLRISKEYATLDLTAEATHIPTALVDAMGSFNGLLVAALGPQVEARSKAEQFSLNTGKLTARLEAANGWMEGIVKGRGGVLQLSQANPLKAELEVTPALRDRLLYKIHPLLADIRTTEQPLRIVVPSASVPVTGDVSQLNARIEITIGPVEIDGGSTSLFLLKLFNTNRGKAIPGSIEPIVATITNGVLTYDKFAVHVDKYRMEYSGTIDLNTGSVNLRTELPLDALAASVEELRGYANITVPIVTRGSFGNLKTQIDPQFDIAREAIKGGLKGALDDLLGGDKKKKDKDAEEKPKPEDQVGDILDSILRGVGRRRDQSHTQSEQPGTGDDNDDNGGNEASPRRRQG